jgi:uncharacterized protein
MSEVVKLEAGSMGRVAYARIAPNKDICEGVEELCQLHGFQNAFVRGGLGSLVDGCLGRLNGSVTHVSGPAVEIVSLAGEVRTDPYGVIKASLTGVVADTSGKIYGGPFVRNRNLVCVTLEITLEEWLPWSSLTNTDT